MVVLMAEQTDKALMAQVVGNLEAAAREVGAAMAGLAVHVVAGAQVAGAAGVVVLVARWCDTGRRVGGGRPGLKRGMHVVCTH